MTDLILIILFVLYFVPSIIAINSQHPQVGPIVIINLFFGWSLIGWVIALAWAFSAQKAVDTKQS